MLVLRESRGRLPEFIEKGVLASLVRRESFGGLINEELGDEIDGFRRGGETENLRPEVGLDLGEIKVREGAVHGLDLLAGGSAEDLDDFDQLIDARFAGEQRLSQQELSQNAPGGPDIDARTIIGGSKDELRRSVVPGADVGYIGLGGDQFLGAAPVAELEHIGGGVDEQVLRLDVAVANAQRVDVAEGPEELIDVELDAEDGDGDFSLGIGSGNPVDGVGDVF